MTLNCKFQTSSSSKYTLASARDHLDVDFSTESRICASLLSTDPGFLSVFAGLHGAWNLASAGGNTIKISEEHLILKLKNHD